MQLVLGPSELQTELTFDIFDGVKDDPRPIDTIGIYLSGGIDSTALMVVILTELLASNQINKFDIVCYTVSKKDFSTELTPKLISILESKFDVKIKHKNFIENSSISDSNIGIKTLVENFVSNKSTVFYTGINMPPPKKIVEFKNKLDMGYRPEKNKVFYYSPFLFLHKPQILDIFYKLNCEDLIQYTYSCTMNEVTPCQNCYACEERAWGFKMLNKIDPLLAQK